MVSGATLKYDITADNSDFKQALDEARRQSDKTFKKTEQSAKRYAKTVRNEMLKVGTSIATVLSVQKVKEYADSWIRVENKIKSTGIAFERVKSVQQDLLNLSNRTRSKLSDTADLYQKIGMNAEKLKLSEKERLRLTETINKGFAISGATGNTKSGAITQIGQGLGDIFAAQELNSVFDSSMTLTKALLKEFSVDSTKALKELAANGEVTGERVAKAWISASKQIDLEFARSRGTISDSFTVLENNFTAFIGQLDEASGASDILSDLILTLADNLDEIGKMMVIATGAMAGFYAPSVIAGIGRTITLIRGIGTAGLFAQAGMGPIAALLGAAVAVVLLYSDAIENLTTKQHQLDDATKQTMIANENFKIVLNDVDNLNKKAAGSSGELAQKYREQAQSALQLAKAEATKNAELARSTVTKAQARQQQAQELLQQKQADFNAMGISRFGHGGAGLQGEMEKANSQKEAAHHNLTIAEQELQKAESNLTTIDGRITKAGILPKINASKGSNEYTRRSSIKKNIPAGLKSATSVSENTSEADIQKIILDDLNKQEAALIKIKEAQQAWGKEAGESLANAVLGAKDFKGALQNIAQTIIQDLLPELGKIAFGQSNAFSGESGSGLGGILASAIGSGVGSMFGDMSFGSSNTSTLNMGSELQNGVGASFGFGGAMAAGGFTKGGKAYQVGESGPEMFIPKTDGMILPHHIMRSMHKMEAAKNTHQNSFNVTMNVQANDAGSFKKSQSQIIGDLNRQMNAMSRRVV